MRDLLTLPTFAGKDLFHVVVESPRGSTLKMKYSRELGAMSISRPLALGLTYPYDWGFVPSTQGPDGDPIDALVFWDVSSYPGVVIPCRALAVLQVEQNREGHADQRVRNDRIVAVPDKHRRAGASSSALSQRMRQELEHFFVAATAFEGKDPVILGWDGDAAAVGLIRSAAFHPVVSQ
jgi:inorganic pyrophosphatase